MVQRLYAALLADGVSAWAVADCHAILGRALKHAVRLELVARNVCEAVTPPRAPKREMDVWDASQARRFLAIAGESAYGPIWMLTLTTGMRRGEILGLRWQDIDLHAGALQVRQTIGRVGSALLAGTPKTPSSRRAITILPTVVDALRGHKASQNERRLAAGTAWTDNDLVFASEVGTPIQPSNLRRDFLALAARAGVPAIRIHDQRHTYATLGLGSGAPLRTISEAMGHADPAITMRTYAHVLPEHRRELAARMDGVFFGPNDAARGTDAGQTDAAESDALEKKRARTQKGHDSG